MTWILAGLGCWTIGGFGHAWWTCDHGERWSMYTLPATLFAVATALVVWTSSSVSAAAVALALVGACLLLARLVPPRLVLLQRFGAQIEAAESHDAGLPEQRLHTIDRARKYLMLAPIPTRGRYYHVRSRVLAQLDRAEEAGTAAHAAATMGRPVALVDAAAVIAEGGRHPEQARSLAETATRNADLTPADRGRAIMLIADLSDPRARAEIVAAAVDGRSTSGLPVVLDGAVSAQLTVEIARTLAPANPSKALDLTLRHLRRASSLAPGVVEDLREIASQAFERRSLDAFSSGREDEFVASMRELVESGCHASLQCVTALAMYWHHHGDALLAQLACFAARSSPLGPVMRRPTERPALAIQAQEALAQAAHTIGVTDLFERTLPAARALVLNALLFPKSGDEKVRTRCFAAWDLAFEGTDAEQQAAADAFRTEIARAATDSDLLAWMRDHLHAANLGGRFDSVAEECSRVQAAAPVLELAFAEAHRVPAADELYRIAAEMILIFAREDHSRLERLAKEAMKQCGQLELQSRQLRAWHWVGLASVCRFVGQHQFARAALDSALRESSGYPHDSLAQLEFYEKLHYWTRDLGFPDFAESAKGRARSIVSSLTAPFLSGKFQKDENTDLAADAGKRLLGVVSPDTVHKRPR